MDLSTVELYTVAELVTKFSWHCMTFSHFVWVKGEVANLHFSQRGHVFFSLQDGQFLLDCVVFSSALAENGVINTVTGELLNEETSTLSPHSLHVGDCIYCAGRIMPYKSRSKYQFVVEIVQSIAVGNVHIEKIERAKQYDSLGYFDAKNKRTIVKNPRYLLIFTSLYGAAIRDFLCTVQSLALDVSIFIYPIPVQGTHAVSSICEAVESIKRSYGRGTSSVFPIDDIYFSDIARIVHDEDYTTQSLKMTHNMLSMARLCTLQEVLTLPIELVVFIRGGGAQTDLATFDDHILITTMQNFPIPYVTGLGHATDSTFLDRMADASYITPTAVGYALWSAKRDAVERLEVCARSLEYYGVLTCRRCLFRIEKMAKRLLVLLEKLPSIRRYYDNVRKSLYAIVFFRRVCAFFFERITALQQRLRHAISKKIYTLYTLLQQVREGSIVSMQVYTTCVNARVDFTCRLLHRCCDRCTVIMQMYINKITYLLAFSKTMVNNLLERNVQRYATVMQCLCYNSPDGILQKGYCKLELMEDTEQNNTVSYKGIPLRSYRVHSAEGTFFVYGVVPTKEDL